MTEPIILIPGISVVLLLAVWTIRVYNFGHKLRIELSERQAAYQTIQAKLNVVYAEIHQLLIRYSLHESELLNAVARGQANPQVLASQYPQLQADSLYQDACNKCSGLYGELEQGLARYNSKVTEFNAYVSNFPRVLICRVLGMRSRRHAKIS